jgi:beta-galactosidase
VGLLPSSSVCNIQKGSGLFESSRRSFLRSTSLATAGVLLPASLRAVASGTHTPASGPATFLRLDRGWQFRKGSLDGVWGVWRNEDDSLWRPASLPHSFNANDACDPDHPYFQGQGWYRTRVQIANPFAGGRTLLHFRGAGQTTTLWVGTTKIGTHKGGYDEFAFDITEAIAALPSGDTAAAGIPIAILCDNSPDVERVPSNLSDFCLYGGLYRHVSLVYLPALALDAVHVLPTLAQDGSAQVLVKARLFNPGALTSECSISVEATDLDGRVLFSTTRTHAPSPGFLDLASFTIAQPRLWSPDSPHLYRCRVTLTSAAGATTVEARFGVRSLEFVEHGPFKLNGSRLLLRGTSRHADHAGMAAAMPDDLVRQELEMVRDMGANFIRLAHYQQDRLVLDLCDELGLMVWEEVPWCRAGVGDAAFQQNAKDMLAHMIDQHINHPSIILWGLGNEDDWPGEYPRLDQRAIRQFMTEMRDIARSLDCSRLTSFRRCDFARDIPDVYSPSIWAGWYGGNYHDYEKSLATQRERVKRLIHMEWGADSHAGRHSEDPEAALRKVPAHGATAEQGLAYKKGGYPPRMSSDGDWSETYACLLFDWHLKTQEKLDWLTGSAQWIFKDFASPLRGDSAIPRMNQKGVVERDLTKKESYYLFQSHWASKPMVHIYGHTWPVRWGHAGQTRPVHVFSNCDHAELFLNGKSLGGKRRDSQDFPAAGLRWDVAFASGTNKLRAIATQGTATVTDEIELTYETQAWTTPAELRLIEKARTADTVTLAATLHDANGRLCLDAAHTVRFSLAGDGRLIDNLGTTRGSRELQLANGRAQISFQRTGACSVGVVSAGLPAAFLKIT